MQTRAALLRELLLVGLSVQQSATTMARSWACLSASMLVQQWERVAQLTVWWSGFSLAQRMEPLSASHWARWLGRL